MKHRKYIIIIIITFIFILFLSQTNIKNFLSKVLFQRDLKNPKYLTFNLEESLSTKRQLLVKIETAGISVEGRPIEVIELGEGEEVTLFLGVFHGDEPQGKYILNRLKEYLIDNPDILHNKKVVLVPVVNPDGLARKTRVNANGVDINRNFPTRDWDSKPTKVKFMPGIKPLSEPETKAVISILKKYNPQKIISIHSPMRCVNYDGPAKELAIEISKYNKYPVKSYIGYSTPGSFGTYAGKERNIPVVTLEVPNISDEEVWSQNKDALIAAIKFNINTNKIENHKSQNISQ